MKFPKISEYVKAIQDAGANLDKLAHLSAVLDDQGVPYYMSDDSSVVFKMLDKNTGKCYALKCFTIDSKGCADARLQNADEQNMVESSNSSSVKYLEKELLVLSQGKEEKYPVELMDWGDEESMGAFQSVNEDMSSRLTFKELNEANTDEFGVKYSKDGRKLLKAPYELNGTFSIKEGTKIICDWAFSDCSSLSSLVIPDSVISIGYGAFEGCFSLGSLVIPDSVTSIGNCAFHDCSSLGSLVIPDGVISIGESAFLCCSSLRSLVIPNSVISIGDSAFLRCSSLRSLVIPDSVTSIGNEAFRGCNLPDNLKQE